VISLLSGVFGGLLFPAKDLFVRAMRRLNSHRLAGSTQHAVIAGSLVPQVAHSFLGFFMADIHTVLV
jgi:hypothetical protein